MRGKTLLLMAFTNLEMLFHDYEPYPMHQSGGYVHARRSGARQGPYGTTIEKRNGVGHCVILPSAARD